MNPAILKPDVQHYLRTLETADAADIALRKSPFTDIQPVELAQQVEGRQRCQKKLPLWYNTLGIYYPKRLAIEQASSALTAQYKGFLVPRGSRMIDLTGGFGVDACYLARHATTLTYCEQDAELAAIARHNFNVLEASNISVEAADGLAFLRNLPDEAFDYVYIDPARRKNRQKVFLLSDCEPDMTGIQQLLLEKARRICVKAAPLLDISAALRVLQHVCEVHIVSVDNECKELLFVLDRTYNGEPNLTAAALSNDGQERIFRFTLAEEQAAMPVFGAPGDYLYAPDAALLKAGAFKCISHRFNLQKLHPHTHLYTSDREQPDFIGRAFQINEVMPYAIFKKNGTGLQANCSTRNFPLDVAALRKKHKIRDGGDRFLFFCTGPGDELLVIFASKS